jgi:hypothetical protein
METMQSIPSDGIAVVFGAKGGIGAALLAAIASSGRFSSVMGFPADKDGALDITNETEIEHAAREAGANGQIRLVLVATGKIERHIRLLLPLAFISPAMVRAIANGSAPTRLTVTGLAKRVPLPWN